MSKKVSRSATSSPLAKQSIQEPHSAFDVVGSDSVLKSQTFKTRSQLYLTQKKKLAKHQYQRRADSIGSYNSFENYQASLSMAATNQ